MRRQLYRGGGITSLRRQKYGLGDFVRKLIPNELADVAVKAAPFVAPFNPAIAGLMRGIGRYDQRGSLSDALKQGVATTALGAGARYLGGAAPMGGGLRGGFTSPVGPSSPFQGFIGGADKATEAARTVGTSGAPGGGDPSMFLKPASDQSFLNKVLYGSKEGAPIFGDKGLIGAGGSFDIGQSFGKGLPAVFAGSTIAAYAAQKALGDVGERESGESLEAYNKRRKGTVGKYLDMYFRRANRFRIPPEEMDAAAAKFVADNTKEYVSQGGRIGFSEGTNKYLTPRIGDLWEADLGGGPLENIVKMGMTIRAPFIDVIRMVYGTGKKATEIIKKAAELGFDLTKPAREAIGYVAKKGLEGTKFALGQSDKFRYGTKNYYALRMAGMSDDEARLFLQDNKVGEFRKDKDLIKKLESRLMDEKVGESPDVISMSEVSLYPGREKTKRMRQMGGTGPNGLPVIPRMAPDGMEFDMRQNGGFQPLGAKEKKDDVPAMLAKNEFVFTADAVRGAGNGDIELGAQKMYDTMKNLERRVT